MNRHIVIFGSVILAFLLAIFWIWYSFNKSDKPTVQYSLVNAIDDIGGVDAIRYSNVPGTTDDDLFIRDQDAVDFIVGILRQLSGEVISNEPRQESDGSFSGPLRIAPNLEVILLGKDKKTLSFIISHRSLWYCTDCLDSAFVEINADELISVTAKLDINVPRGQ